MSVRKRVGAALAPKVTNLAPGMTSSFVHQALDKAITGVGPLPSAASAADKQLHEQDGDVERALALYTELYGQNAKFRDVAEKVRRLGGRR
jgi:hypothetical protein